LKFNGVCPGVLAVDGVIWQFAGSFWTFLVCGVISEVVYDSVIGIILLL